MHGNGYLEASRWFGDRTKGSFAAVHESVRGPGCVMPFKDHEKRKAYQRAWAAAKRAKNRNLAESPPTNIGRQI
jgi:hypothetical protein